MTLQRVHPDTQGAVTDRLEAALGRRPSSLAPLTDGGHGAHVWRLDFGRDRLVAMVAARHLASEGRMLRDLAAAGWPVPGVHFSDDRLLVMDWIDHDGIGLSDDGLNAAPPGFLERRRDLDNLYPLLVHVALFGDPYSAMVARTLDRYESMQPGRMPGP